MWNKRFLPVNKVTVVKKITIILKQDILRSGSDIIPVSNAEHNIFHWLLTANIFYVGISKEITRMPINLRMIHYRTVEVKAKSATD